MGKQWMNFVWFSLVFVGIILTSVIFGGYSSLHRSEGRIDITKELFFKACQNKLDLLPQLLDYLQKSEPKETYARLELTGKEAGAVLHSAVFQKAPLNNAMTLKLEASQLSLTNELAKLFLKLERSKNKSNTESFKAIKQQFFSAQDKLSTAKVQYNIEVRYFNRRTKIFPGFLIAELFGFNNSEYFELSKDSFLGADRTFGGKG